MLHGVKGLHIGRRENGLARERSGDRYRPARDALLKWAALREEMADSTEQVNTLRRL